MIPITVPPLRERPEDIPLLVEHFAARLAGETGLSPRRPEACAGSPPRPSSALVRHPFPGNVRELRNLVERLLIMTPAERIDAEHVLAVLPPSEPPGAGRPAQEPENGRLAEAVRRFEQQRIEAALAATGGSMTEAAARLGLERSHLYKKMKKLGVNPPADRARESA